MKAVALLSGGLDSQLAIRVIQQQGIDVHAVTYRAPFHGDPPPGGKLSAQEAADRLSVPLTVLRSDAEFLAILGAPEHGWREAEEAVDRLAARFGRGSVRPARLITEPASERDGQGPPRHSRPGLPD